MVHKGKNWVVLFNQFVIFLFKYFYTICNFQGCDMIYNFKKKKNTVFIIIVFDFFMMRLIIIIQVKLWDVIFDNHMITKLLCCLVCMWLSYIG